MKTINDLLKEYDLDLEAPDYVLDYVIGEDDDEFGEYHQEEHDGEIIHVFKSEGDVEGRDYKMISEYILDLNGEPSWNEYKRFDIEEAGFQKGVVFHEDGTMTEFRS